MMKNNITIFLLKTDLSEIKIPFISAPCAYDGSNAIIMPIVEDTVESCQQQNNKSIDDTFVVSLRRHFSAREIRHFISLYFRHHKTFLLFSCDSIQRSDLVMNTIKSIYGQENISRVEN